MGLRIKADPEMCGYYFFEDRAKDDEPFNLIATLSSPIPKVLSDRIVARYNAFEAGGCVERMVARIKELNLRPLFDSDLPFRDCFDKLEALLSQEKKGER